MMYIEKGNAPLELMQEQKDGVKEYADLKTSTKDAIREQLLREQGYLCAYCMRRIGLDKMQIEHYLAQHPENANYNPAFTLSYKNMLGVCVGEKNTARRYNQLTCDQHRKNKPLTVDPLDQRTIQKICYKADGAIYSNDAAIEEDLNCILNLNCLEALLMQNRKSALDTLKHHLKKKFGDKPLTHSYLQTLINKYRFGKNGQKQEYAGILLWYLEKKKRVYKIN